MQVLVGMATCILLLVLLGIYTTLCSTPGESPVFGWIADTLGVRTYEPALRLDEPALRTLLRMVPRLGVDALPVQQSPSAGTFLSSAALQSVRLWGGRLAPAARCASGLGLNPGPIRYDAMRYDLGTIRARPVRRSLRVTLGRPLFRPLQMSFVFRRVLERSTALFFSRAPPKDYSKKTDGPQPINGEITKLLNGGAAAQYGSAPQKGAKAPPAAAAGGCCAVM